MQNRQMNDYTLLLCCRWRDLFCRFPQLRWFILPFSSAEMIYSAVFLSWRDLFCRFPQLKGFILSFSYLFCFGHLVLTEGTLYICKQLLYISAFLLIHYCYVFFINMIKLKISSQCVLIGNVVQYNMSDLQNNLESDVQQHWLYAYRPLPIKQ